MAEEAKEHGDIIIVKRGHDDHDDHHGGVWKIAFADFMTAMMAFFLVMWLINASNEQTRKAVAAYFNPVKLMDTTTNPKGIKNPKYGIEQETQTEVEEVTTVNETPKTPATAGAGTPHFDEKALFVDPHALLSEIEGGINENADNSIGGESSPNENKKDGIGLEGGVSFKDPFDPSSWNVREGRTKPKDAPTSEEEMGSLRDEFDKQSDGTKPGSLTAQEGDELNLTNRKPEEDAIMAGEQDGGGKSDQEEISQEVLDLVAKLQAQIANLKEVLADSGLNVEIVEGVDGASVILSDKSQNGMFDIGSARPTRDMVIAMKEIGKAIMEHNGKIEISGHTDGRQYQSVEYDNWRLSSARAHMAYYMLERGGMDKTKVDRIVGQADVRLKNPEDPLSSENRRIEVLLKVE